ncbi:MAG: hypothetical protein ACK6D3_15530, partial [Planctomycetaceae bacterium]
GPSPAPAMVNARRRRYCPEGTDGLVWSQPRREVRLPWNSDWGRGRGPDLALVGPAPKPVGPSLVG